MTLESMEVYSLEEGDTIKVLGNLYVISDMVPVDTGYILYLKDEEGYSKTLTVSDTDKIRVVVA